MISGAGDRGTPDYRRESQGILRLKSLAMFWIWKVFGLVIGFGSEQLVSILLKQLPSP
jgi:hypothetical protein